MIKRFSSCQLQIFGSSVLFCQTFFWPQISCSLFHAVSTGRVLKKRANLPHLFQFSGSMNTTCFVSCGNAKTKVVHLLVGFCFVFASVIFYVIVFSCQLTIFVFVCLKTHSYSSAQNFKTERCCLGRTDRGREKVACFRQFSFSWFGFIIRKGNT